MARRASRWGRAATVSRAHRALRPVVRKRNRRQPRRHRGRRRLLRPRVTVGRWGSAAHRPAAPAHLCRRQQFAPTSPTVSTPSSPSFRLARTYRTLTVNKPCAYPLKRQRLDDRCRDTGSHDPRSQSLFTQQSQCISGNALKPAMRGVRRLVFQKKTQTSAQDSKSTLDDVMGLNILYPCEDQ